MLEKLGIGDKVIYPAHGAGVIEGIENKVVSGREQRFYVMRLLQSGARIMIPTDTLGSARIRRPVSRKEVEEIYRILGSRDSSPAEVHAETWNKRNQRQSLMVTTGSPLEIAKLLKALHQTKETRPLGLGETKIMSTAMDLLVGEVMFASHLQEETARREIEVLLEPT